MAYRKPRTNKQRSSRPPRTQQKNTRRPSRPTKQKDGGWERVSNWYDGMVGDIGSKYHTDVVIPKTLQLMGIQKGERMLDIGCGQGVLAPHVKKAGGEYLGVDVSRNLVQIAKKRHSTSGTFFLGNAAKLANVSEITEGSLDVAVFMLSIQDIKPHTAAIASAAWALREGGRMVLLMTHPAFRIPRQSGWGFDKQRKLVYRRVDSYLSKLDVPLRIDHKTRKTLTRSYHRPLESYLNSLIKNKLRMTTFEEIPEPIKAEGERSTADIRAKKEIPLFLGIRAEKMATA